MTGNISVIIVSWNARSYLRGCLDSIYRSEVTVLREVIVVDNASSDGSPEMVSELYPEVVLIKAGENLGFARANNLGLSRATGEWLAFINSDVLVHDQCLQRLVSFLNAHPDVGLAGPRVVGGNGELQRTCRRFPTLWNTVCRVFALDNILGRWSLFSGRDMRHWNHLEEANVEVVSGCFWMARRGAVESVGGLDSRFFFYAEDVDWCKRFRDSGWSVAYDPQSSATHFGGGSSGNAPLRYSIEMLRANLSYWQKYKGLPGRLAFYILSIFHHGVRVILRAGMVMFDRDASSEKAYKLRRSWHCLRWLLGRSVDAP